MTKKTPAAAKTTAAAASTSAVPATANIGQTADASTYIASSPIEHAEITTLDAPQLAAQAPANVLIRPTVGRKVWYRPDERDRHSHMQFIEGEPLDATILAVHGDRSINAQVLDINGTPFVRRNWALVQQGDDKPAGSYFEWMPYQTGQAAKAA